MEQLESILKELGFIKSPFWRKKLQEVERSQISVHLAIFIEPFLEWVLNGKKTIESRFSINKCAPYLKVKEGDLILIKRTGGPIVAVASAGIVWSYNIQPESWDEIKGFSKLLCAHDPSFWETRKNASYATLIKLDNVSKINPVPFVKRDRRGWVVLKQAL